MLLLAIVEVSAQYISKV